MKEMTNKKKTLIAVILAVVIAVIILVFALMGCQNKDAATPDEATATLTTETIAQQETEAVTTVTDKVIAEQGLTVNENGEVIDNEGNKVEKNEDGTYTVKTEAGETVKVTAEEVKKAPVNNNTNTNAGTNNKPANNNNKPANSTSSTTSKVENNSSDKPVSSNTNTDNKKPDTNTSSNTSSNTTTKTWHEAEYKYVNHPAETKTEKVWVVDKEATTKEEPVYEKQWRTICNTCFADITGDVTAHAKSHLFNNENCSYHHEQVEIQTGTKTVEVPEEGHWETKTTVIKEAWTEKVLVREAGYY